MRARTAPLQLHLDPTIDRIGADRWDAWLATHEQPTPFLRHAYLAALHASASACPHTGWTPRYASLWAGGQLRACCLLYLKAHSRGEYVFDWAWADAYARHGLAYYPKVVIAVPFTPVPGGRLLGADHGARTQLLQMLERWAVDGGVSSLHLLFPSASDLAAARAAGWMQRDTVQFHWHNRHPQRGDAFRGFDDFLATLTQEKRKKIRQERRRVADAGVLFRTRAGAQITGADWDFFYRCYERTYLEHGNPPYLTRDFFVRMQADMPSSWVLFIAEREGRPIACSLIAVDADTASAAALNHSKNSAAYGRYWGALERVDCLHFEACYYQPIAWCIAQSVTRFEGGAQGEHKMARALLPTPAHSAHWLAHPGFADAVADYLAREKDAVAQYLDALDARSPLRHTV